DVGDVELDDAGTGRRIRINDCLSQCPGACKRRWVDPVVAVVQHGEDVGSHGWGDSVLKLLNAQGHAPAARPPVFSGPRPQPAWNPVAQSPVRIVLARARMTNGKLRIWGGHSRILDGE